MATRLEIHKIPGIVDSHIEQHANALQTLLASLDLNTPPRIAATVLRARDLTMRLRGVLANGVWAQSVDDACVVYNVPLHEFLNRLTDAPKPKTKETRSIRIVCTSPKEGDIDIELGLSEDLIAGHVSAAVSFRSNRLTLRLSG